MTDLTNTSAKTIEVINDDGRTFTVRVILQGDNYGFKDSCTHMEPDVLVEFYDKTCDKWTNVFVTRYYLSTISEDPIIGIQLGSVDEWHVSAQNVQDTIAFANTVIANQEVA